MPVVQEGSMRAACAYDKIDRETRDSAVRWVHPDDDRKSDRLFKSLNVRTVFA